MSILAPNTSMMNRRICCREHQSFHLSFNSNSSCINMPSTAVSIPTNFKNGSKRERKTGAFWDSSRPVSIEMETINSVEELDEILADSKEKNQPIIIDWMASWCRKCIYLKPKLEKLAAEYHPRLKFYYIDVNKVPQSLVKKGNISKMPTIQLWKNGEWTAEIIGGHKAWLVMDEVREMIQKNI